MAETTATTTTVLWYRPGAASLAVHLTLEELGIPYVLKHVGADGSGGEEALRGVNPDGRVPVLEHDGLVLTESAAICLLLAERDPARRLLPPAGSAEHAETVRTLVFLTNTMQEAFLRVFYPERYLEPADSEEAGNADEAVEAVARAAGTRLHGLFDRLESTIAERGTVTGGDVTVADLYLFMLTRWGRRLDPPAWTRPALRRHWLELAERPAIARVLADEGLLGDQPPA